MTKYKNKYRIESTRLPHWDYGNPGTYFVTICTKKFQYWFGEVVNGKMVLNEMGEVADSCWAEIPDHFDHIELDEYVVMPNHVHGIIGIMDVETLPEKVKTRHAVSLREHTNKFGPLKKGALSTIIGSYKSAVTGEIRESHNPNFGWHPRFYDHVIRNEYSLEKIQYYIQMNPKNWIKDRNVIEGNKIFISKLKVNP